MHILWFTVDARRCKAISVTAVRLQPDVMCRDKEINRNSKKSKMGGGRGDMQFAISR
jgi:hypothetical protein